ncbi:MAG: hypothetical protein PWP75_150, partial [Caldanaerobacter sp.]|nr:hypothetical protein [Caldanaerobacter sp.]
MIPLQILFYILFYTEALSKSIAFCNFYYKKLQLPNYFFSLGANVEYELQDNLFLL